MCSNCNNMNSFNNPNLSTGTIGLNIENGNNVLLGSNVMPYNNDVIGNNLSAGCFNNNSCGTDVLGVNNSCTWNSNGNNNCNCNNNTCGCNCNVSNDNTCNCNGTNNNDNDNITRDSLQRNLRNFIGRRITVELNNCGNNSKKTGVLTCVGCDFITLRSLNNNNCLLIDTTGLNFVTIHPMC